MSVFNVEVFQVLFLKIAFSSSAYSEIRLFPIRAMPLHLFSVYGRVFLFSLTKSDKVICIFFLPRVAHLQPFFADVSCFHILIYNVQNRLFVVPGRVCFSKTLVMKHGNILDVYNI